MLRLRQEGVIVAQLTKSRVLILALSVVIIFAAIVALRWSSNRVEPATAEAVRSAGSKPAQQPPVNGATYQGALRPGQQLNVDDAVVSTNGQTVLLMQGDGNLVLYANAVPVWASETYLNPTSRGTRAVMQTDGNFVINDGSGKTVFSTNALSASVPGSILSVRDDGSLDVTAPDGARILEIAKSYLGDLKVGQALTKGTDLVGADGRARLSLQSDGNLVAYRDGSIVWDAVTEKFGGTLASGKGWTADGQVRQVVIGADGRLLAVSQAYPTFGDTYKPVFTTTLLSGGRSAYLKADADGYFRFYTADQRPIATFGQ